MNDVEFPRRQAEAILKKTMREVGYRRTYTEIGLWSAFWLEERFQRGVTKLIVYLCLVNGRSIAELCPRIHPEFGIAGVCPFMMAEAVIHLSDKWGPRGGVTFGAPAEPFLMMASVADWASAKGQSVRFHHRNYSCLMSNEGVDIETDDLSAVGWIDPDNESPMTIELTDDRPSPGARRIDTIRLPKARLRGRNALFLG